jgi:hypothetical protein
MIEYKDGNKLSISFEDWHEAMYALSSKLHHLPLAKGETGPKTHELGIDELNNLAGGDKVIEDLFWLVDELKVAPDYKEVVRLGKIVMRTNVELNVLLAKRRRDRVYLQDRRQRLKKLAPIRTVGPIGFRRGN